MIPATRVRSGRQSAEAAEQTRLQILEAALTCFASRGFGSTSLRDIAERAGVTHGLPRHHFGSKEALWRACAGHVLAQIETRQRDALEAVSTDDALQAFREVVRIFVTSAAAFPDFWRLVAFEAMAGGERLLALAAMAMPQHERIAVLFAAVKAQGQFPDFDNDSFFLSVLCLGAMPFAMTPLSNLLVGGDLLDPATAERHADRVIALLFGA